MTLTICSYGSLIFKAPPHAVERHVGFIKGYVRRFAQSSNDHRGTPEHLGRVVTLVKWREWEELSGERTLESERKVWAVGWRIDPEKEDEVRENLEHREKNGYSSHLVNLYNHDEAGEEVVVAKDCSVYIGTTDNEAFVGSEPLDVLASRIQSSAGPSGLNKDYLYNLAESVRELDPEAEFGDPYLFTLERAVRALDKAGDGEEKEGEKAAQSVASKTEDDETAQAVKDKVHEEEKEAGEEVRVVA